MRLPRHARREVVPHDGLRVPAAENSGQPGDKIHRGAHVLKNVFASVSSSGGVNRLQP